MDDRCPPAVAPTVVPLAAVLTPPEPALSTALLATAPVALCCLDATQRIRYANRAAERLLGRPATGLLGRPVDAVLPSDVAAAVLTACAEAMSSAGPVAVELPTPGAGARWVELHAWPTPVGPAFAFIDITIRRRAQEAGERARQAAERAGARLALLAAVSAELAGARDVESALGSLARLVVPDLADGCIVTVIDRDGRARDVGSWHADPDRREVVARYAAVRMDTLPETSPVARALRAGTEARESVDSVLGLMPPGPARDLLLALRPESAVVLPLPAGDRPVGVLTLYLDPGRTPDADDLAAAREVADRAGRAVDRVHRASRQAQLAEALQRSLLTEPLSVDGAQLEVRYVPAAEAAQVGGDWYDAFLHPAGDPVLVIGDVAGHDTAAAAEMGQLRGLLRGIAHYSGAGPAEVLRGLDAAMGHMYPGTLATAAIARVERDGTELRWASAGHPPPLVADPDGTVSVLSRGFGDLLLGVDPTTARREFTAPLPLGATVLLYTDGLVERRDRSVDAGVAHLQRQLAELVGLPLDRLCDELLARMLAGVPQDDVALVALRLQPAGRFAGAAG
ncbi:SpoIIE family protein phosphatase [Geodermatophilus sabuli]|uniref:PAS domain S-box-containing protein n=1 Tax=Geodermatophilus sabuli TaxID=1564158 RepID=A0A285EHW8_9ACTN|nr:SpoIIE family protein phosphatase [Geodermatophilus sabuli]SNX97626.1 PAS domain S-box-containing protein [Geodermatophilus sabuli]